MIPCYACSVEKCLISKRKALYILGCEDGKPRTKGDLVRSMPDEELAELFESPLFVNKPWCTLHEEPCRQLDSDEFMCSECLLNWLKQEVE